MTFKKPIMATLERIRQATIDCNSQERSPAVVPLNIDRSVDYFVHKKGTTNLIVVPYLVSDKNHPARIPVGYAWPRKDVYVHRLIGSSNEIVACPGRGCPICAHRWELIESGMDKKSKSVTKFDRKLRSLYHVINVDEDPDKVLLWDVSFYLFSGLLDKRVEAKEGNPLYEGYFDPDNGAIFEVDFEVKKFEKWEYINTTSILFSQRKPLPDTVWEQVIDLDASVVHSTHKELQIMLKESFYEDEVMSRDMTVNATFPIETIETKPSLYAEEVAGAPEYKDEQKHAVPPSESGMDDMPF